MFSSVSNRLMFRKFVSKNFVDAVCLVIVKLFRTVMEDLTLVVNGFDNYSIPVTVFSGCASL